MSKSVKIILLIEDTTAGRLAQIKDTLNIIINLVNDFEVSLKSIFTIFTHQFISRLFFAINLDSSELVSPQISHNSKRVFSQKSWERDSISNIAQFHLKNAK